MAGKTDQLLSVLVASNLALLRKLGITESEVKMMLSGKSLQSYIGAADAPALNEAILKTDYFTRVYLDLTAARTLAEFNITGTWIMVESTTATVAVNLYLNRNSDPLPDPLDLRYVRHISAPFRKFYITHAADAAKAVTLLVGRSGAQIWLA